MSGDNVMIPKRIFYVWFGGGAPHWLVHNVANWQEYCEDFEIIKIDENSPYFDFKYEYENCLFFRIFYDQKLYALASDYVRCKVLYDYGGIYLDTDITLRQNLTPLLNNKFFLGTQDDFGNLGVGIFGAVEHYTLLHDMVDVYKYEYFKDKKVTIVDYMTDLIERNKYEDLVCYPKEYFYPYSYDSIYSQNCLTNSTYAIHWWGASWLGNYDKLCDKAYWIASNKTLYLLKKRLKRYLRNIIKIFKRFC